MDTIQRNVTGRGASAKPNRAETTNDVEDAEDDEKHPHVQHPKPKKSLRKAAVARRYSVTTRTVDRNFKPDFYIGKIPFWDEDRLDERDQKAREALARQRAEVAREAEAG